MTTKIFTIAHIPEELVQQWLQHLRNFDVAHPGCHFEIAIDTPPQMSVQEMTQMLVVEPGLTFADIFERRKS